ncbi:hypothetical protein BDR04DRAFT_1122868 [Suillus decipiens]|nr:hypothetical protein BDR04DRAFT_1122868 [Suillus decipiens]
MDKLTSCELNRLITQETRREGDASDMGHLLPLIFKSFDPTNLPATDTLKDSTNKPLYDTTMKQWSLVLPKKGSFPPLWYGSSSTVPVESSIVTPEINIHENPDTFKYIMTIFHSLPDQLPSPTEFADEPRTDSSPLVDPPDLKNTKDDDVIGKITINENVKGDKTIVLNEVEMLKTLKDIPGVPQYIEHCLVEVEPGKVDNTQMYRQKIYSSTQALRDIVLIQKCVVEEHQVLHRDCSLNNSMIEDTKDGSRGALIDWEFTACITSNNMYSAGRTGTIPFMSVSALRAMGKLNYQYSQVMKSIKELKLATDHLTPEKMPKIKHTHHDDLESMFYVFAWICIMFKGPMGEERCLEDIMDRDPEKMEMWLPERWHGMPGEVTQKAEAKHYFFLGDSMKSCIGEQFAPYFKKLVPLAEEWYDLMGAKKMKVEFDEVVSLFNKHINDLSDEENDSEELLKKAKRLGDGKEEENDDTLAPSK